MCGENSRKFGTRNALRTVCRRCNGGARVSVMFWGAFVKMGWVQSQM